ncbi:MAG: hypothetical protein PVI23_12930 [Maricaulaceae bacterium]|jgi:hypothetical protein
MKSVRRASLRAVVIGLAIGIGLASCASPPSNTSNACAIFAEKRGWWDAVRDSERRWGAPPSVQLAILYQESAFEHDARPPRRRILFVIPGLRRQSSSYGFAQATRSTWDWYKDETGRRSADRDSFRDATDFVGWYARKSRELSGIALDDARNQYLAYHEGHGGFNRGSYRGDRALIARADAVGARAARYEAQLEGCRRRLDRRFLFIF